MHKVKNSSFFNGEDCTKIMECGYDSKIFTSVSDGYLWSSFSEEKEDLLNETPRISTYNHSLYVNPERKLAYNPSRFTISNEISSLKTAAELVKEIVTLEIEIVQLEHHLLSLYRTAFDDYLKGSSNVSSDRSSQSSGAMLTHKDSNKLANYKIRRFKSDPSYKETNSNLKCSDSDDIVSHVEKDALKVDSDHLYDTTQFKDANMDPATIVPCNLSEEIIRCIAAIYFKIANKTKTKRDKMFFPASSLSFSSTVSQRSSGESWSPQYQHEASASSSSSKIDDKLYSDMVEIPMISVDGERFGFASKMLSIFRVLIKHLKSVDPRKMAYQEQIAFWLNIHNALVMHAFLAYGLHHGGMKSKSSILKAAYNVGGHSINAYVIQSSILCCEPHFSVSWLEVLLSPSLKFMKRKKKHLYALHHPQPLVHFALCQGAYSDPPVRVYTANNVEFELEHARKEFIQANVKAQNKTKIILPKILCYYMKDCSLQTSKLLKMVSECMPEGEQGAGGERIEGRTDDCIVWLKYDSRFRYMISRDLANQ